MKRENIYKINEDCYGSQRKFVGWFNADKTTLLAERKSGSGYVDYSELLITAGGRLVMHESNNYGMTSYYRTVSSTDAVEIINSDGHAAGMGWAEGKGAKAFSDAEIK